MAAYYKTRGGKKYDGKIIDIVEKAPGDDDGKLTAACVNAIQKAFEDGGEVTTKEIETIKYIVATYEINKPEKEVIKMMIKRGAGKLQGTVESVKETKADAPATPPAVPAAAPVVAAVAAPVAPPVVRGPVDVCDGEPA